MQTVWRSGQFSSKVGGTEGGQHEDFYGENHVSWANTDADEHHAIKGSSSPVPVNSDEPLFLTISGAQGSRRMAAAARLTLLLLGCVGLLLPVDGRYISYCPDGWSYYKLSCFKYFTESRSWDEAESLCEDVQKGAHLAWVENAQEAVVLKRAIFYHQHVQPVWIGLQKNKESQAWQWTSGKEYNVASEMPGNGARGGSCAALTHHSGFSVWSSAECSQKHPFICKFNPLQ